MEPYKQPSESAFLLSLLINSMENAFPVRKPKVAQRPYLFIKGVTKKHDDLVGLVLLEALA